MKELCVEMATGGKFSYENYEEKRQITMSYPELQGVWPAWLVKCRYGQQYWSFISSKFSSYRERKEFLYSEFNKIIDQLRQGYEYPIVASLENSLSDIDNETLKSVWRKVVQRAKSDPEGAITASKTMLETVFKYVLDLECESYTKNDDFIALYGKVKKVLNLDPKNHNLETFKTILKGITSVVQGMGSLRNDYGDAHGKGKESFYPEQRHAEIVINLTGSLSSFILDTYKAKQVAARKLSS
jgi:hypothetical protein